METDRFAEIAEAKRLDWIERAKRPFEEKIRMLIQMQKRYAEIAALRGVKTRVWNID
jgi:hypothetical protein